MVASHAPHTGEPCPQPRHVSWLGVELVTPCFICSLVLNHWTTPVRAYYAFFNWNSLIYLFCYCLHYRYYFVILVDFTHLPFFLFHCLFISVQLSFCIFKYMYFFSHSLLSLLFCTSFRHTARWPHKHVLQRMIPLKLQTATWPCTRSPHHHWPYSPCCKPQPWKPTESPLSTLKE